jgi:hypothetical protein
MSLQLPVVNGEFYIDDMVNDFYLREDGVWEKKGRLFRANVVGFYGEGPFLDADRFQLAAAKGPITYTQAFSAANSSVTCDAPTAASCDVVFTDSLSLFLGRGERAICTAHFEGVANEATLTFLDGAIVAAGSPVWLVLPSTADVAMAGLRALIAGIPS